MVANVNSYIKPHKLLRRLLTGAGGKNVVLSGFSRQYPMGEHAYRSGGGERMGREGRWVRGAGYDVKRDR